MAVFAEFCEAGHDYDRAPLAFRLPIIGRLVDIGSCSRGREINFKTAFLCSGNASTVNNEGAT